MNCHHLLSFANMTFLWRINSFKALPALQRFTNINFAVTPHLSNDVMISIELNLRTSYLISGLACPEDHWSKGSKIEIFL